jgi:hypothetical protein
MADAPSAPKPPASQIEPPKESILSNRDDTFDIGHAVHEHEETGTIISDKRRKRAGFFATIKEAADEWVGERHDTLENIGLIKNEEVPKVAPGETRKEVVAKALSTGNPVLHDDHRQVVERIRTFQQDAERAGKPIVLKPAASDQTPSWHHTVGEAEPSITRESVTDGAVSVAPQVTKRLVREVEEYATPPVRPRETPPPVPPPRPQPAPVVAVPKAPPVPAPVPVAAEAHPQAQQPISNPPAPQRRETPAAEPHAVRRMFLVIVYACCIVILLGGAGYGGYRGYVALQSRPSQAPEAPVASNPFPTTVPGGSKAPNQAAGATVALSAQRSLLLADMLRALSAASGASAAVTIASPTGEAATPSEFFDSLAGGEPDTFPRALSGMRFGGVRAGGAMQPYLAFSVANFDTAFAGMLAWENSMSGDLEPLFGGRVLGTALPSAVAAARAASTTPDFEAPHFIDRIAEGQPVRILYDVEGNERITYAFPDHATLIITTSRDALAAAALLAK